MESQSKTQNNFKHKFLSLFPIPTLIGIVVGAVGGWVYYTEIGCSSGTCPLTSNPYTSILWGAVMGYLLGDIFKRKKKPETPEVKDGQDKELEV